ncbi:hypothetical protein AWH48_07900 [Domibacillus aminovorans]|uniref:Uncharacterized protein n=1 Tax=Domibacillus aminovorans TaxID=29332 RepID=A0A177KM50_9BACI|nr:hypothetical protein [Domibacillus aminovorans]OAH54508.1 hypothetical protein AWH48_07900 [Domibacillus aminovorans]
MSKHALFSWLKKQFPDAQIQTGRDFRVLHPNGTISVFIYLEEKMPLKTWYEHQDQYVLAGVHPIWILDADEYVHYSKSKYASGARIRNHIPKAIFNETGFCYYLEKRTYRFIIDIAFHTREIWLYKHGRKLSHLYDFHDPFQQEYDLEDAYFLNGLIVYKKVEARMLEKQNH